MSTTLPKFTLDDPKYAYEAVSYGDTWNGWLTPVVTRQTLTALIRNEDPTGKRLKLTFDDAGVATIYDKSWDDALGVDYEPDTIQPDANGNYDLGLLGWPFDYTDEDWERMRRPQESTTTK